ncbi:hypothetical protein pdam_00012018 [Pocillopora damicornis]|uniref:Uncharacterized protein n=1 Tax=Pocillopora damicornis TaxID=46731 RepID=A0A3M6THL0_POCDA|nr:hypothetical protein pdam_00012018 [Pocillopora damicornis]
MIEVKESYLVDEDPLEMTGTCPDDFQSHNFLGNPPKWSPFASSLVLQGFDQVCSASDEDKFAHELERLDAPQPVTRADDTLLDVRSAPQCGLGSWEVNEGTHVLRHHFVD